MAAADHIKSLITSYAEDDQHRFFATAMQIAASEARQGHTNVAQELKLVIEKARKGKSAAFLDSNRAMPLNAPKRELKELLEVLKPRISLGDMVLAPEVGRALDKVVKEQQKREILQQHNLAPKRKLLLTGPPRDWKNNDRASLGR